MDFDRDKQRALRRTGSQLAKDALIIAFERVNLAMEMPNFHGGVYSDVSVVHVGSNRATSNTGTVSLIAEKHSRHFLR